MKPGHCAATSHDFDKFDDATIYCRKCGEQRTIDLYAAMARIPAPIYLPCPWQHYPSYPSTWRPYPTYPWTWTVVSPNVSDSMTLTTENTSNTVKVLT